jgi:hypothetical protein
VACRRPKSPAEQREDQTDAIRERVKVLTEAIDELRELLAWAMQNDRLRQAKPSS